MKREREGSTLEKNERGKERERANKRMIEKQREKQGRDREKAKATDGEKET